MRVLSIKLSPFAKAFYRWFYNENTVEMSEGKSAFRLLIKCRLLSPGVMNKAKARNI